DVGMTTGIVLLATGVALMLLLGREEDDWRFRGRVICYF
ncbi:MAG: hypothetical protein ACI9HK_005318, partial [Pirellulaceae bacterium]